MTRHPLDATALIFGLLFTLAGIAILSEETWPSIDTTAVVGAWVGSLGLLFIAVLVLRQVRTTTTTGQDDRSEPGREGDHSSS